MTRWFGCLPATDSRPAASSGAGRRREWWAHEQRRRFPNCCLKKCGCTWRQTDRPVKYRATNEHWTPSAHRGPAPLRHRTPPSINTWMENQSKVETETK
jgi:hypothetical protein